MAYRGSRTTSVGCLVTPVDDVHPLRM